MGLSRLWYYIMHAAGFGLMAVVTVRRCEKKGVERRRGVVYALFTILSGILGAMLMGQIYTAASHAVGESETSYVAIFGAVVFTPGFLMTALALLKRRDPAVRAGQILDCVTPGSFLAVMCGKTGCFLYGCCWGVPWERGVFNPLAGGRVFPVQLCEVASMLAVLLVVGAAEKSSFFRTGMAYPLTAALYAAVRFGWEFLRGYTPRMRRFLWGMTFWQLCCVGVFAVSVVALVILASKRKTPAESPSPGAASA